MTPEEHFVQCCLESPKQDFPEKAYLGDVLHYLDGTFYVYYKKWIPIEEATIFETSKGKAPVY